MSSNSSRVGTASNLNVGGSYDLLMVKMTVSGTFPEGQISFGLYDVPMKITGIQKVAQHFLRTLLTSKGSDPFYPEKGTYLPALMVGSNITEDNSTFISDITSSVNDAAIQVRSMLNVNTVDLESTLDTVQVLGVDRIEEGWFVIINLITLAGENASISVPFPEFGLDDAFDAGSEIVPVIAAPATPSPVIPRDQTLTWKVSSPVVSDIGLNWSVLSSTTSDLTISYNVLSSGFSDRLYLFDDLPVLPTAGAPIAYTNQYSTMTGTGTLVMLAQADTFLPGGPGVNGGTIFLAAGTGSPRLSFTEGFQHVEMVTSSTRTVRVRFYDASNNQLGGDFTLLPVSSTEWNVLGTMDLTSVSTVGNPARSMTFNLASGTIAIDWLRVY